MTPEDHDYLQRRAWDDEKSQSERNTVEALIVANLSAVALVTLFGWDTLWIWPIFLGFYFLVKARL